MDELEYYEYLQPLPQIRKEVPATTPSSRIGVGRQTLPVGLDEWPFFMYNPPFQQLDSSKDRATAWATGVIKGLKTEYPQMKPSVVSDPKATKYIPGAGGVAGAVVDAKYKPLKHKK